MAVEMQNNTATLEKFGRLLYTYTYSYNSAVPLQSIYSREKKLLKEKRKLYQKAYISFTYNVYKWKQNITL